jgi:hypothetical protein
MNKETGLAIKKAYNEVNTIILNSESRDDCINQLELWFGGFTKEFRYIYENYGNIKKSLDKHTKDTI